MDMQGQIYLILLISSSFFLIFFVAIIIICGLMCYLKREIKDLKKVNRERYAYNNPTIQPGEELSVRGYQMIHSPVKLVRQGDGSYSLPKRDDIPQLTHRCRIYDTEADRISAHTDVSRDFRKYRTAIENEKPLRKSSYENNRMIMTKTDYKNIENNSNPYCCTEQNHQQTM